MPSSLAIFAKAPTRGAVKTRLAAAIGDDAALQVYRALLEQTAAAVAAWPGPARLHATGSAADWADSPLAELPRVAQRGEDLGQRLAHGLRLELAGAHRAIAIGTDCPALSAEDLLAVDALLQQHDAAFAPAEDGGYWALGVGSERAIDVACASDLPWSQPELLDASEARCAAAGLRCARGPRRADLDTLEDLRAAERAGFSW